MKRIFLLLLVIACSCTGKRKTITLTNTLPFDRTEVISLSADGLEAPKEGETAVLEDVSTGEVYPAQHVDWNSDGQADSLLFYVSIPASGKRTFYFDGRNVDDSTHTFRTYSRLVPERIDDYAWENDLVAFRTYGPAAQKITESGQAGGTLSSGIDCWLKRVRYPVIDRWYKKHVDGGNYHKDDGEGYDPYHVGKSRGCGGIGIWNDDSLYVSKNFVSYKEIARGPYRTVFELTYAPWDFRGVQVQEKKRISIDLGNQFFRVEEFITGSNPLPGVTVGLTLHDKKGQVSIDSAKGMFCYWEPIDDSELGTAVIINPRVIKGTTDYRTSKTDLSHLYIHASPDTPLVYYAGFAWKKAGTIKTFGEWKSYLETAAQRTNNPLIVSVK